MAVKIMLLEGGLKNKDCLVLFTELFCFHEDVYIREKLIDVLIECDKHKCHGRKYGYVE